MEESPLKFKNGDRVILKSINGRKNAKSSLPLPATVIEVRDNAMKIRHPYVVCDDEHQLFYVHENEIEPLEEKENASQGVEENSHGQNTKPAAE